MTSAKARRAEVEEARARIRRWRADVERRIRALRQAHQRQLTSRAPVAVPYLKAFRALEAARTILRPKVVEARRQELWAHLGRTPALSQAVRSLLTRQILLDHLTEALRAEVEARAQALWATLAAKWRLPLRL